MKYLKFRFKQIKPALRFLLAIFFLSIQPAYSQDIFFAESTQLQPETTEIEYPRAIAVIIENEPPARPQSGLYFADIVFEIVAEEITRFMAIYYDTAENLKKPIGPVRSVRHYFTDLAHNSLNAIICHNGGSPQGLQFIKDFKVENLCAIRGARNFYRRGPRKMPHNLWTRLELIEKEIERRKYERQVSYDNFPFPQTDQPLFGGPLKSITIQYYKKYKVSYSYDSADNRFKRSYNNRSLTDYTDKTEVRVDNIVILRINQKMIDSQMRHDMDLDEGGQCLYFIGGHQFNGYWQRQPFTSRLEFFDNENELIEFNPGNIWIQFVKPDLKISIEFNELKTTEPEIDTEIIQ